MVARAKTNVAAVLTAVVPVKMMALEAVGSKPVAPWTIPSSTHRVEVTAARFPDSRLCASVGDKQTKKVSLYTNENF